MRDKKKIAIALLLSVIVFIIVLLGQIMVEQRTAKSPNALPSPQTEQPRDPAPPGQTDMTQAPGQAQHANPAAPADPTGATQPGGAAQDTPQKP